MRTDVERIIKLKRIADFNDVIVHDFLVGTFEDVLSWIAWNGGSDISDEVVLCFGKLVEDKQTIKLDLKTWRLYDKDGFEIVSEQKVLDDWYCASKSIIAVDFDAYPDFEKPEVDPIINLTRGQACIFKNKGE
jgi:hypothetical protein